MIQMAPISSLDPLLSKNGCNRSHALLLVRAGAKSIAQPMCDRGANVDICVSAYT